MTIFSSSYENYPDGMNIWKASQMYPSIGQRLFRQDTPQFGVKQMQPSMENMPSKYEWWVPQNMEGFAVKR